MLTDENEENRISSDDHKSITFEDFILMNDLDLDEETNTTNTEDNKRKSAEDVNQSRMKKVRMDAGGDSSNPENSSSPVSERYPYLDLPPSLPPYLLNDEPFTPHSDLQLQLVQHGYPSLAAAKALYWTGNTSLETGGNVLKQVNCAFTDQIIHSCDLVEVSRPEHLEHAAVPGDRNDEGGPGDEKQRCPGQTLLQRLGIRQHQG